MQSGEENFSSGHFNPVGRLQQTHQTAFLNAPQSKRIFPTSVGSVAVQNLYSIMSILISVLAVLVLTQWIFSKPSQCSPQILPKPET